MAATRSRQQKIRKEDEILSKYFTRIEEELNAMIKKLTMNMLEAVDEKEWETVLLSAGVIMDTVKSIHPIASGNLHRIMTGKYHGDEPANDLNFG